MSTYEAKNTIPQDWIDRIELERNKKNITHSEELVLKEFIKMYKDTKSISTISKITGKSFGVIKRLRQEIEEGHK